MDRHRYPGAQPFSDDDLSRRVFFGREEASRSLADKILANRLVVVYGRSGLGKTSLLNAGLAPLLRDEGCLPLFVRVNDAKKGAFRAVVDALAPEALRQCVEYAPGLTDSLWSLFKTAEFWRGDLLLTPVLIIDQFEEIFTLQGDEERSRLLDELSYLTRGVAPPSARPRVGEELSERAPPIRIVLSLREDYLGFLDEAADRIPQILDARFRLAPLDFDAAERAITGPALVRDAGLDTRPFALHRDAVGTILTFLSQRRARALADSRRVVEPFQLQLICRRIERIAAARQRESSSDVTITMADIGGESALTATLRDFYSEAVGGLRDKRARRAARRLCEDCLINAEGRRLSVEEGEICRQLELTPDALAQLVSSRLLRTEHRSDSVYYELSHDALVEPILASQHRKAMVTAWLGITGGAVFAVLSAFALLVAVAVVVTYEFGSVADVATRTGEIIGFALVVFAGVALIVLSVGFVRYGARVLSKQRHAHRAGAGPYRSRLRAEDRPRQRGAEGSRPLKGRGKAIPRGMVGGTLALLLGGSLALFGVLLFVVAVLLIAVWVDADMQSAALALDLGAQVRQVVEHGVGLDLVASIVFSIAVIAVGGRIVNWGGYRLAGVALPEQRDEAGTPDLAGAHGRGISQALRIAAGLVLLAAALLIVAESVFLIDCAYLSPGESGRSAALRWFTFLAEQCAPAYELVEVDLAASTLMIALCLYVGIPLLRQGISAFARNPDGSRVQVLRKALHKAD